MISKNGYGKSFVKNFTQPDLSTKKSCMTAKFSNGSQILEVTKNGDKVDFFVYEFGEEQVGQSIEPATSKISDLVKHLESIQMVKQ